MKEPVRINKSTELFRKDEIKEILTPKKYDFYKLSYPMANSNAASSEAHMTNNYPRNSPSIFNYQEQYDPQYRYVLYL